MAPAPPASPHVTGAPLAAQRRGHVQVRPCGRFQHEDVALLVRRASIAVVGPDGQGSSPDLPAQAFVEMVGAGAEGTELEAPGDLDVDLPHDLCPETGTLTRRVHG